MRINKIFTLFIIIALVASSQGCKKNVEKPEVTILDPIRGNLTIWNASSSEHDILGNAIVKFKEKHAEVNISVINVDIEDFSVKLETSLNSKNIAPDFIVLPNEAHVYLRKYSEVFIDFSNEITALKDKFIKSKLNQITFEGKVLSLPWYITPVCMLYRIDLFDEYGVKAEDVKTWEDFVQVGDKIIKQSSGKYKFLPLNASGDDEFYRQLLNQLGIWYYDKDGKLILSSDESIKAIKTIKKMQDAGLIYDVSSEKSVMNLVKSGEIVTILSDSAIIPKVVENAKETNQKWGIMKIPAFEPGGNTSSAINYTTIGVTKIGQNIKVALELAKFCVMDKEFINSLLTDKADFPLYLEFYNDSILDSKVKSFANEKIWRALADDIKEAPEIIANDEYFVIKKEILKAQKGILSEGKDIRSSLEAIEKNMGKLIKK